MESNCGLDERQLWIRGNVYKHCLLIMGALIILDAMLIDSGVIWAETLDSAIIIVTLTTMIGSIEMICRDVYMSVSNRTMVIIGLMAVCSGISMAMTVIEIVSGKSALILHSELTGSGFTLITSVCIFIICIVFVLKSIYNKRHEEEE